jgi:hypothetical protein
VVWNPSTTREREVVPEVAVLRCGLRADHTKFVAGASLGRLKAVSKLLSPTAMTIYFWIITSQVAYTSGPQSP